ncbi:MAG: T9SS type A sorting domain-containing protein [Bacteroidota bacterium]
MLGYLHSLIALALLIVPGALQAQPPSTVSSQAELNALSVVVADTGKVVLRQGYYEAGDGGGMNFRLYHGSNPLLANLQGSIIPGLIFPAGARQSKSESVTFSSANSRQRDTTSCAPVIPGSYSITLSGTDAGGNSYTVALADSSMHGVVWQGRENWKPLLNYATGKFQEREGPGGFAMKGLFARHLGGTSQDSWSISGTVEYDCAQDNLYWVAIRPEGGALLSNTTEWDARWFGARSEAQEAYFDNTDALGWASWGIKRFNQLQLGTAESLHLPDPECSTACDGELYWRAGTVQLPSGVMLTGDVGVTLASTDSTDEHGNNYRPVVLPEVATVLKTLPPPQSMGSIVLGGPPPSVCPSCRIQLDATLARRDYAEPYHLAPDARILLAYSTNSIQPEYAASSFKARDIVVDVSFREDSFYDDFYEDNGYYDNTPGYRIDHEYAETGPVYTYDELNEAVRNTPGSIGFAQSSHGDNTGLRIPSNQKFNLTNVGVLNTHSNGVLSYWVDRPVLRSDWHNFRDLYFRDAGTFNHALYLYGCTEITNVTIEGVGWGHTALQCSEVENLVVKNLIANPHHSESYVIGVRGGARYSTCQDAIDDPYNIYNNCPNKINNYYVDIGNFQGSPKSVFGVAGPDITIENGVIVQGDFKQMSPFGVSLNYDADSLQAYSDNHFSDLTVVASDGNAASAILNNDWHVWESSVENVDFKNTSSSSLDYDFKYCTRIRGATSGRPGGGDPQSFVWKNIGETEAAHCEKLIQYKPSSNRERRHWYIDSNFRNTNAYFMIDDGDDKDSIGDYCSSGAPCAKLDNTPILFVNSTFELPGQLKREEADLFYEVSRFRNVVSEEGWVSEDSLLWVCPQDTSGTYQRAIATNLLWTPHPLRGQVEFGGDLGPILDADSTSWSFVDGDGTAFASNETKETPLFGFELPNGCSENDTLTVNVTVARLLDKSGNLLDVPDTEAWHAGQRVAAENALEAKQDAALPGSPRLDAVYPNPSRGGAISIVVEMPEPGPVRVDVFDLLGRTISVLADERMEAGRHQAELNTHGLGSGVYFVRFRSGDEVQTRKITVLR